ncbi:serine/threonine-protein kinase STN7 [Pyrus ussuriensis x Pyrus communis]|uniref:Serine/threonine-protein kinase STN7 n=1 Tax=Pyrus ussuriensis x Pyrus communis TaxID=2448454 RepID=A0A5N5G5F1_9ROSA|nr:serine/threonine-protein kinase STN7 [Pyrus ussuriensis x Pyrus communis]
MVVMETGGGMEMEQLMVARLDGQAHGFLQLDQHMDPFIGVAKLRPHQSKPIYPFLSRKLKIKPSVESQLPSSSRITISNSKTLVVFASGDGELIHAVHDMFLGVGLGLLCTVMKCGDVILEALVPKSDDFTLTAPLSPSFFPFLSVVFSQGFLADLPFSLPSAVFHPISQFPSTFTAIGCGVSSWCALICCLPLLAVLLVDYHELLSLGCKFSGTWMLVSVRRGFVWGPNLTGSTCTAAILVVASAILADVAVAVVVSVCVVFWAQLLLGPLLVVCIFVLGPLCCKFWASVL